MNRLREAVQEIWDGPCSCSVCRQRLTATAASCLGGHMFCTRCRQQLAVCLVCKKRFSAETHAAFKRVLECLPKCCKHTGCQEAPDSVPRLLEHETWCAHRPAGCQLCNWSGQAKDLYSHCLRQHKVIHKSQQPLDVVLNTTQDHYSLCVVYTQEQMFWVKCRFDKTTECINVQVIWEPDGTVTSNMFKANLNFVSSDGQTTMTKLIVHQAAGITSQLDQFKVNLASIKSFCTGDTVKFGLSIMRK